MINEAKKSGIFASVLKRLFTKIRYLITDFDNSTGKIVFLCYGSRAFFTKNIADVISEDKVISGLHPEQACFLGIIYARWIKEMRINCNSEKYIGLKGRHNYNSSVEDQIIFDRSGNIIFTDRRTRETKIIKAHIVASTSELISRFNPVVACSIGMYIGSNIRKISDSEMNPVSSQIVTSENVVIFKKRSQ